MTVKKCYFFLIPFSFVYYILISFRNFFYSAGIFRAHSINAKVISVGNITWGGTGKTPLVIFIVEALLRRGSKVAILIRGYGKDEPKLLSRLTSDVPILVGKNRVKNARKAISRYGVDTILLDDGFQYRPLKRNLDIVCIDALEPFGKGWVIPAGSMREAFSSLKRADIFLLTKVDLVKDRTQLDNLEELLNEVAPKALIVKSIHRPLYFYNISNEEKVNINELKNKEIVLLSAIGSPNSFEKTILRLGLKVNKHFIFRDHYWYTERDLKKIEDYCIKHNIDTVITTEKDFVKLRTTLRLRSGQAHNAQPFGFAQGRRTTNMIVLTIKLEITENEEQFLYRLLRGCNS